MYGPFLIDLATVVSCIRLRYHLVRLRTMKRSVRLLERVL